MSTDPNATGNPLDPRRRPGAPEHPEELARQPRRAEGSTEDPSGPQSPDPDPMNTPGLEPGGGVAPGDTPPSEAGTAVSPVPDVKGPSAAANLAIPLSIVGVIVLGALALLLARLFGLF